jgi:hypothetical protein
MLIFKKNEISITFLNHIIYNFSMSYFNNKLIKFVESIMKVLRIENERNDLQSIPQTKAYLEMEDTESAQKIIDKCINLF